MRCSNVANVDEPSIGPKCSIERSDLRSVTCSGCFKRAVRASHRISSCSCSVRRGGRYSVKRYSYSMSVCVRGRFLGNGPFEAFTDHGGKLVQQCHDLTVG